MFVALSRCRTQRRRRRARALLRVTTTLARAAATQQRRAVIDKLLVPRASRVEAWSRFAPGGGALLRAMHPAQSLLSITPWRAACLGWQLGRGRGSPIVCTWSGARSPLSSVVWREPCLPRTKKCWTSWREERRPRTSGRRAPLCRRDQAYVSSLSLSTALQQCLAYKCLNAAAHSAQTSHRFVLRPPFLSHDSKRALCSTSGAGELTDS